MALFFNILYLDEYDK